MKNRGKENGVGETGVRTNVSSFLSFLFPFNFTHFFTFSIRYICIDVASKDPSPDQGTIVLNSAQIKNAAPILEFIISSLLILLFCPPSCPQRMCCILYHSSVIFSSHISFLHLPTILCFCFAPDSFCSWCY